MIFYKVLKKAKIILNRLENYTKEIKEKKLIENLNIDNKEDIKLIDSFVYRFSFLQDYIGQNLFKNFLIETGDYMENMSFIDILDKLEKIGIIENVDEWIKIRKIRNIIAHDYLEDVEEIKFFLGKALEYVSLFREVINRIERYLKDRKRL